MSTLLFTFQLFYRSPDTWNLSRVKRQRLDHIVSEEEGLNKLVEDRIESRTKHAAQLPSEAGQTFLSHMAMI